MTPTSPSTSPKLVSTAPSSPPRTPVDQSASASTPPSDESVIDDLSFDYVFDDDGNYVRFTKGASKSNYPSPPTPPEILPSQPEPSKPSPPINRRSSLSRSESAYPVLINSVSASSPHSDTQNPRSFHRVSSSSSISNNKARPFPRRVPIEDNKKRSHYRQVRADVLQHEKENIIASDHEQGFDSAVASSRAVPSHGSLLRSASLTDPHQRQILPGPNRPGRVMKLVGANIPVRYPPSIDYSIPESPYTAADEVLLETEPDPEDDHISQSSTPFPSVETVPESAGSEDAGTPELAKFSRTSTQSRLKGIPPSSSAKEASFPKEKMLPISRPRRSASLSDAVSPQDQVAQHQSSQQVSLQQHHQDSRDQQVDNRLGSSTNENNGGSRRILAEEKEFEVKPDYNKKYRREVDEVDRRQVEQENRYHQRPLSLPQVPKSQPDHRRRDSDTLRSLSRAGGSGSPTHIDSRPSSRLAGNSPPGTHIGRLSPLGKASPPGQKVGRTSPPTAPGIKKPSPASVSARPLRRSPTAPEPAIRREDQARSQNLADQGEDKAGPEREREREARRPQQSQPQHVRLPSTTPAPAPSSTATTNPSLGRNIMVNKKSYARLDMIGKGGSSRVFRVLSSSNELYAIKRVSLDKTDTDTMNCYMNEIALLKRLEGNSRIIRLFDSEVKGGPGGARGHLFLVLECGEIDLFRLINERAGEPLNMVWVAYYWQQMMQAVHVLHEEKIVHSDLKPANFVLVRGQLKLIDFGIANAIANDTTNIQRDHQIGTVNFMSPEAIEFPDGMRRLKVGRPSDVWSLGCILYQMVYGQPPFQHLSMLQRMRAIPDSNYTIAFPEYSVPVSQPVRLSNGGAGATTPPKKLEHLKRKVHPDVIKSMKACLCRNPKERATIPELLDHAWLEMKEPEKPAVKNLLAADETVINPYYMRQLLQYGIKLGEAGKTNTSSEALMREAERLVAELKSIQ